MFTHTGCGVYASGGGTVYADASKFSNNNTGVMAASGSSAVSSGNNTFTADVNDGTFTSTVAVK